MSCCSSDCLDLGRGSCISVWKNLSCSKKKYPNVCDNLELLWNPILTWRLDAGLQSKYTIACFRENLAQQDIIASISTCSFWVKYLSSGLHHLSQSRRQSTPFPTNLSSTLVMSTNRCTRIYCIVCTLGVCVGLSILCNVCIQRLATWSVVLARRNPISFRTTINHAPRRQSWLLLTFIYSLINQWNRQEYQQSVRSEHALASPAFAPRAATAIACVSVLIVTVWDTMIAFPRYWRAVSKDLVFVSSYALSFLKRCQK